MVPPEFRRKFTITSGAISLTQAILWSLAAIYSIAAFKCVLRFPFLHTTTGDAINNWDLLYVTYFQGGCGYASYLNLVNAVPESAKNMELWMIVYSLVSSVWIPCCMLLIVAAVGEVRGLYGSYLYYPWIVVTSVLVVMDIIAACLHLNDVFQTLTNDTFANFLTGGTITTWAGLPWGSATNQAMSFLPSLFATLFFWRGFIFWMWNIVMVFKIVKVCHSVAMYKTRHEETIDLTSSASGHKGWLDIFYQGPDPLLVVERTKLDKSNDQSTFQGLDSPIQRSIKEFELHGSKEKGFAQRPSNKASELSSTPRAVDSSGIPMEEIIPRVSSRRNSIERSNSFQNKGRVFDYMGRPSSFRDVSNERSPYNRGFEHLPPAELRNQMPFSYIHPANAPPPRPVSRDYGVDAPPVPIPDYTLHFNRTQNPSSPDTPQNKPRVLRKPTEDYFKFPPPLKRNAPQPYTNQAGSPYKVTRGYSQSPKTPESYLSDSRDLGLEVHRA
uniref:Uncharacterized protein n=1 Tax=Clastoptera arizonana TaxID=38151 RepID=A0A1B6DJH7_9HEMI